MSTQVKDAADGTTDSREDGDRMSTDRQGGSQGGGQSGLTIDDVGYRILDELRTNGRLSMAALAEKVGISRANAYTRVETLVQHGVITGFSARIDPAKAGLGICALVFVTVHPQTWTSFRERIQEMPDIESCRITTGEHDAMLLIRAADVGSVHDFVIGVVAPLPEVKSVETVLVLDEVLQRPYLLPTDLQVREQAVSEMGLMRFTHTNPDRPGRR